MGFGIRAETVEWRNAEGLSIYFQGRAREFSDALVVWNERESEE